MINYYTGKLKVLIKKNNFNKSMSTPKFQNRFRIPSSRFEHHDFNGGHIIFKKQSINQVFCTINMTFFKMFDILLINLTKKLSLQCNIKNEN
jgi:hypothetical protein